MRPRSCMWVTVPTSWPLKTVFTLWPRSSTARQEHHSFSVNFPSAYQSWETRVNIVSGSICLWQRKAKRKLPATAQTQTTQNLSVGSSSLQTCRWCASFHWAPVGYLLTLSSQAFISAALHLKPKFDHIKVFFFFNYSSILIKNCCVCN